MSNIAPLHRPAASSDGALRLDAESLLLFGAVRFRLGSESVISIEGKATKPPYTGLQFTIGSEAYYLLVLHSPLCRGKEMLSGLQVQTGTQITPLPPRRIDVEEMRHFHHLLARCDDTALQQIAGFLRDMPSSPLLAALTRQLGEQITSPALTLEYGCWLNPQTLYVEGEVSDLWPETTPQLLLHYGNGMQEIAARLFQIGEKEYALIAQLPAPVYTEAYQEFALALRSGNTLFPIRGMLSRKAFGLEFCQHLNSRSEYLKHFIREQLSRFLLERLSPGTRDETAHLLRKLQRFIQVAPVSCIDAQLPFNLHVENCIPVGNEGMFVSGWMRDPYAMVESMEMVSALGFSVSFADRIYSFSRPDIEEGFRNTPYGHIHENHGFMAYIPLPETIRRQLDGLAELHDVRFAVTLKGGGSFEIVPEPRFRDSQAARHFLLKGFPPEHVTPEMLTECLAPAIAATHAAYLANSRIARHYRFGAATPSPQVSILIPLYRNLSLAAAQMAQFATDAAMRNAELIYVLDSVAQADEAKALFQRLSDIYSLPVSLLVLTQDSGFAQAVNLAAEQAAASLLLILQSDVIPAAPGWLEPLCEALLADETCGMVAPTLWHEDDSLQLGGQQVEKTGEEYTISAEYQGYPWSFPALRETRDAALLGSGCLLIRREEFRRLGGLCSGSIAGHLEGADLSLKLAEAHKRLRVVGTSRLYHLTAQSLHYNDLYHHSLAQPYSRHRFTRRWRDRLEMLAGGKN